MGKSKKKSKSNVNSEKGHSDDHSSTTQDSETSTTQIDIASVSGSEQKVEETKNNNGANTTNPSDESEQIQSDMKRRKSGGFEDSDRTGFDQRKNTREYPNSRHKNYHESNYDKRNSSYGSSYDRKGPYRRTNQNGDREPQKRFGYNESDSRRRDTRDSSNSRRNYRSNRDVDYDEEFSEYQKELKSHGGNIDYVKTKETFGDLFKVPDEYSLAHCVAVDMNMGAGIAVEFRYRFKRVAELLNQYQSTGGLAILKDKDRYIYYLVTKPFSSGKPTYASLFASLKKLRDHVIDNGVKKIAMPRIGCGLDRLEWEDVKFMIEFVFRDVDIEILVCNLEPTLDVGPQRHRNCKVTHEKYPIQDIEAGTVILYFSSEDEAVSDEMRKLDEKFHFLNEFKYAKKTIGKVIFYNKNQNYLLCGCIVRKSKDDRFDYEALQRCLFEIQKENKKSQHYYFAFQAFKDRDFHVNYKIINILRNYVRDGEVYVCWPGDMQNEMTQRDRFSEGAGEELDRQKSFPRSDGRARSGDRRNNPSWTPKPKPERDWRSSHNETVPRDGPPNGAGQELDRPSYPPKYTPKSGPESNLRGSDADYSWADECEKMDSSPRSSWQQQQPLETPSGQSQVNEDWESNQVEPQKDDSWEVGAWENPTPSTSNEIVESGKPENTSFNENVDQEYQSFKRDLEGGKIDGSAVKEQHPSNLPSQYSRVCFAREDLEINYGIPPGSDIDNSVGKLLKQNVKAGDVAYTKEESNFLYCLIINGVTTSPTSSTVFSAIQKLRNHVTQNGVKKLVIPKTDISSDLEWSDLKCMFQFLLGKKLEITAAQFSTIYNSTTLLKKNSNKITHLKSPIHQMKKKSVILFLASADGLITAEIEGLIKKFPDFREIFLKEIKNKSLGDVIRYKENEDHVLYGCVVKRTNSDGIDFEALYNCLKKVDTENAGKLLVVGIQAVKDQSEGINYKIAILMSNCLHGVTINICWPGDLKSLMPGKTQK